MTKPSTFKSLLLPDHEVHLWYAFPESLTSPELLERYQAMLSAQERDRHIRFMLAKDRHLYLVARALLRTTLSHYADVDVADWSFSTNTYGKPHIVSPTGLMRLQFNLSHAKGLVACVVAHRREVGVDVENVNREVAAVELAERYFATCEADQIKRLPKDQQTGLFFKYWTLKEAYVKARGMGLSIPLDDFWFNFKSDGGVQISFVPGAQDDASVWQFAQYDLTKRHRLAVAAKRLPGQDLDIVVRQTVP